MIVGPVDVVLWSVAVSSAVCSALGVLLHLLRRTNLARRYDLAGLSLGLLSPALRFAFAYVWARCGASARDLRIETGKLLFLLLVCIVPIIVSAIAFVASGTPKLSRWLGEPLR
jgi:hypothetical protein